ncbi:hypothetical protein BVG16_03735 [Paenibacillus selenitireducens]|uniref:Thioredoxin domain-containing protein n=1 Tax=Paenibacillus selenitireducens TaxID=1324314 RepID=A0A1T2XP12_9BACL|nr:hypothetical protein BVG16_03735 [Paenibacillus selenitireducens]
MFIAVVVVVLIGALVVLNNLQPSKADTPPAAGKVYDISTEGQPTIGKPDAKVEVVEFGDFKCPTCRQFETDTFPKLKEQYIDTGKVKLTFINFSFMSQTMGLKDNDSRRAAMFGEAVYKQNPEAFWTYYQELYKNQGDEREAWATEEFLSNIVKQIPGIDVEKVKKDVQDDVNKSELDKDHSIVNRLGISSTPSLFVNGQLSPGYTLDALTPLIEAELAK